MTDILRYPHIAERIFNTPLLVMPAKLDAIIAGLSPRFGISNPDLGGLAAGLGLPVDQAAKDIGAYTTYVGERKQPGYRVVDDVGVIDVFGVLAHRGGMKADSSWILGYQQIARMFEAALADADVQAIVLNMDSPGGEVGGVFDLADQIYSARGIKPIHAVAGNLSASASYLLSSAASEISITSTGWAGSIGVVMRHVDMSAALEKEGLSITHIYAGSHKVDGHPFAALPEDVRGQYQAEIDKLYGMFTGAVSRYRNISEEAVRGTEAQVFMGDRAVEQRLADRVETPDQLIQRLSGQHRQASTHRVSARNPKEQSTMSEQDKEKVAAAETETAVANAKTEGRKAERERINTILTHESAVDRTAQAQTLALETDLDAEAAAKVLAASPKVAATQTGKEKTEFEKHMEQNANSAIHADGDGADASEEENTDLIWSQSIGRVHGSTQQ
ncbi:peptidase s49 [bacterium endosymbiont of Escarpia laminata]|nr:MAG: peptidase s49 [bacterium endosymbiont of Escarpia laminata]